MKRDRVWVTQSPDGARAVATVCLQSRVGSAAEMIACSVDVLEGELSEEAMVRARHALADTVAHGIRTGEWPP